jgi:hypothetical protein
LSEALLVYEPNWKKSLRELTLWSSQRGWQVLPYFFIVVALITGIFAIKPWRALNTNEVVLVEKPKVEPETPAQLPDAKQTQAPTSTPASAAMPLPAPMPMPTSTSTSTSTRVPPVAVATPTPPEPKVKKESPSALKGFLTRGSMEVKDFSKTWPLIKDKIEALGGKVAGNKELGWLRRPNESYFHFSLPESNKDELETFLKTFGRVRFVVQHHPRVMPEGEIRIILTVKDGGTDDEGKTETP